MIKNKNIAAIASGLVNSGVGVVRISGENAVEIANGMFAAKTKIKKFEHAKMYLGDIDCGGFKDLGYLVVFHAPNSFTGENAAEFHCHGGIKIMQAVLKKACSLGCLPAQKGEFTKRAFLNGKISLSGAEGLIDMINAESEKEIKCASNLYREKFNACVRDAAEQIKYLIAGAEASLDFPEEGLIPFDKSAIIKQTRGIKNALQKLISDNRGSRIIKNGVEVVIIGKPNVGKSSLLNALLKADKAIVSDVAGTTRDIVEGRMEIDGIKYNFYDTAGLREVNNQIEQTGIDKARKKTEESDLAIVVLDAALPPDKEEQKIIAETADKNRIIVVNKIDKTPAFARTSDIEISAQTGKNIAKLLQLIKNKTAGTDMNAEFLLNERHFALLNAAVHSLNRLMQQKDNEAELTVIALREAWEALGEISGDNASENIINEIFDKFCVGK